MNTRADARRVRPLGFSLVEVLIVLVIVVLLVALLAPLAGRAREQARRTSCAANLRQIAVGWLAYVQDVDGFPVNTPSVNLILFYGGDDDCGFAGDPHIPNPRPINAYLGAERGDRRSFDVFRCPSDAGLDVRPPYEFPDCDSVMGLFGTSYLTNGNLLVGYRLSSIPFPRVRPFRPEDATVPHAQVILAGDAPFYWAVNPEPPVSGQWHDPAERRMNLTFLDGHASFTRIRPRELTTADYTYRPRW